MSSSSKEEEIDLLERVLYRLAMAETDEAFQKTINTFLAPVLIKITSPNEEVRCKVMEILTHVNKRLKARPLIQLPMESLLSQYKATDSSFLQNFSIIYITMGYPRLPEETQIDLIGNLLGCLDGKPENHQDKIMLLIVPILATIKFSQNLELKQNIIEITKTSSIRKQLVNLMQDILLLPYGITPEAEVPSGMSPYSFRRVVSNKWKAEELEKLKKEICEFIGQDILPYNDALILLVLASADTRFSVATQATNELNKINSTLDWSDPLLSAPFYTLFLGNESKITDRKTTVCSARLRQKLLLYMLKIKDKGINTVKGIQIIFESLFGENTSQKCKVLVFKFTENLLTYGSKDLIGKLSKVILGGIMKILQASPSEPIDVKNAAYYALSKLATVTPDAVNKDLQIVVLNFKELIEAPSELQDSIRDALVSIAGAFKWNEQMGNVKNPNHNLLLALLTEYADSQIPIVQNVTIIYLTNCFPEYYVPARYLLLLIAEEKSSLYETIITHLYGVSRKDQLNYAYVSSISHVISSESNTSSNNKNGITSTIQQKTVILPDFKEFVNYIYEMSEKRLENTANTHKYGSVTLPFTYETYIEILDYMRFCIWFSAGCKSEPGDLKIKHKFSAFICKNYVKTDNRNEIKRYLNIVKNIVLAKRGVIEMTCLYDLLDVSPYDMAKECLDLLDILETSLNFVQEHKRILVSQIYGILVANESENVFNNKITNLSYLAQKSVEHRHGSVLACSHSFYRRINLMKQNKTYDLEMIKNWKEFMDTIVILASLLHEEQQQLLVAAAIKGISLIGSVTELPLKNNLDDDNLIYTMKPNLAKTSPPTKSTIISTIFRLLKNSISRPKLCAEAATCMGYLAIGDGKNFTNNNLNAFLSIVNWTKDPTINIAISQGIVYSILGHDELDNIENISSTSHCDDKQLSDFLLSIIKHVPDTNPNSRVTTGIWLLAIVKYCSKRNPILINKNILQQAFIELLSDDSEFVQDVASRGLGLVYALSDQTSQSDLADSLLNQLIGTQHKVKKVSQDTQIFEEGVLGKTPMGGNITTYKELCSLASDLNQPEMIYQFMQLANHNAKWNSKLGAAFGLKTLSENTREQMKPYLGKIVPRLYRYKYDPTPKIQNSMISIWDSIISNSNETVEKYYWEIFDEICSNLTHVEWRVRIACCLAVRDLLKRPNGLKLKCDDKRNLQDNNEVPEPELEKLWKELFRVMDDVHEGTRLAAEGTAKVLSKICIVASSAENGKSGQRVASSILPFIIETGITHTVPEIRYLSMITISEMIETSGETLRPHLTVLIPCLLKATGELEATKLSYISTQMSGHTDQQEVIDTLRAEVATKHHSMGTVTKSIRYLDYDVLTKVTPNVLDIMKQAVNLGTKIACAVFTSLVTVQFNQEMTPLVGKYLGGCFAGLKDNNAVVRKYYADAIGHLCGVAKEQSIINLCGKLNDLYFENQENKGISLTIHAINKRHPDILIDYATQILPLIFFAMHAKETEENKKTIELWKELWQEISPGDAGVRMNLNAIMDMLLKLLDDSSWSIKTQSATALQTFSNKLGSNLSQDNRKKIINLLIVSISGRAFIGKEEFLLALANLCKGLELNHTELDDNLRKNVIDVCMKECYKSELTYRISAIKSIGIILEEFKVDRFEEVYNMTWNLLNQQDPTDSVDDDDTNNKNAAYERNKQEMSRIHLKETICETLGKAWPVDSRETQNKYEILFIERCSENLPKNTWHVQNSLLIAINKFLEKSKLFELSGGEFDETVHIEKKYKLDTAENLEKICKITLSIIEYILGISNITLKKEALNIFLTLIRRLLNMSNQTTIICLVKQTFSDIQAMLSKDNSPEIKCRLKDIEEELRKFK